MNKKIYLDNASTTPLFSEVKQRICYINDTYYANPSSLHSLGMECELLIKNSRRDLENILNCKNYNIFFTSGATESNNWAVEIALELKKKYGNKIAACKTAHQSITEKIKSEEIKGVKTLFIPVNEKGVVESESISNILTEDTIFVSILLVNNETGVIQPINDIIPTIKKVSPNAIIHIDAVQAFGKLESDFIIDNIDLLSISAHKIGGPKGVGALIAKKNIHVKPLIYGGGQEFNCRGGTENISGICGFSEAAKIISINKKDNYNKISLIQQSFENYLESNINDFIINGKETKRSPFISSVSFKDVPGEVIVHALENENIFISTGSACSSKKNIFSHVLKEMHLDKLYLSGSIRVSFFIYTDSEEVLNTAKALVKAVKKIRKI